MTRIYDALEVTGRPVSIPTAGWLATNIVYEQTRSKDANPVAHNEATFKSRVAGFTDSSIPFQLDWERSEFHIHVDDADWETNIVNWQNGCSWLRDVHGAGAKCIPYGENVLYPQQYVPDEIDVDAQIAHINTNLLQYTDSIFDGVAMTAYPYNRDLAANIDRMARVKRILDAFGLPVWCYTWHRWTGAGATGVPTAEADMPTVFTKRITQWAYDNCDHVIAWDDPAHAWPTPDYAHYVTLDKAAKGRPVR